MWRVVAHRHHVGAVARKAHAFRTRERLLCGTSILGEARVKETQHRDVEAIKPHDGLSAGVAMVVPGPAGRDDEIAGLHRDAFAVHRRIGALAVHDETQRGLRVPVRWRHLARQDQLQTGIERLRDARLSAQRGVLEDQHATHGLLGGDEPPCILKRRPHVGPRPVGRHAARCRFAWNKRVQDLPQWREPQRVDALVEVGPGTRGRGYHRRGPVDAGKDRK